MEKTTLVTTLAAKNVAEETAKKVAEEARAKKLALAENHKHEKQALVNALADGPRFSRQST
jgi:hypothetical protein